jgi:surface protein
MSNDGDSSHNAMFNKFYHAFAFNKPIGEWNVGAVTDMSGMVRKKHFGCCGCIPKVDLTRCCMFWGISFNQDIGSWNVGSVTDMSSMVCLASMERMRLKAAARTSRSGDCQYFSFMLHMHLIKILATGVWVM